jgi:carbon storage regulator CsrA
MLVLQRRPGDSVIIGGVIEITVISVDDSKVTLRIAAPPDMRVRNGNNEQIDERQTQWAMGEAFDIGGGVTVTVISPWRDGIRLGFDGPADVSIVRPDFVKHTRQG